jgi:hypothetical protein
MESKKMTKMTTFHNEWYVKWSHTAYKNFMRDFTDGGKYSEEIKVGVPFTFEQSKGRARMPVKPKLEDYVRIVNGFAVILEGYIVGENGNKFVLRVSAPSTSISVYEDTPRRIWTKIE